MKVNKTFKTLSGHANVLRHAVTPEGTIRVEYRHSTDRPTDGTNIRTFTPKEAREVGLIQ